MQSNMEIVIIIKMFPLTSYIINDDNDHNTDD